MLGLLAPGPPAGLEIGVGLIRAAQVRGSATRPAVSSVGQVRIPDTAVSGGTISDPGVVTEAIRQLWAQSGIRSRQVVIGLSSAHLMMRLTGFPRVPRDKLDQALRLQADDLLPLPSEQLVMDHYVVRELEDDGPGRLEVMLVALQRDQVQQAVEVVQDAGLHPVVMDVVPLAMTRTLTPAQQRSSMLVRIGQGSTVVTAVANGVAHFGRVLPQSLLAFARRRQLALQEALDQVLTETAAADQGDAHGGGELTLAPDTTLGQWCAELADQIRASRSYVVTQTRRDAPELLVMCGRGARIPGLRQLLASSLQMDVELSRPISGFSPGIRSRPGLPVEIESDFAVAVGLALRGLEKLR